MKARDMCSTCGVPSHLPMLPDAPNTGTVGLLAEATGAHVSLALSAAALCVCTLAVFAGIARARSRAVDRAGTQHSAGSDNDPEPA